MMLFQIMLGSALMLGTILLAGLTFWGLEAMRPDRWRSALRTRPHLRVMVGVMVMSLWALLTVTAGVWLWALTFYHLGALATHEEAVYFTIVTFTTLGFGDVLLPQEWRILGGLAAVNGMLNIGMLTAILLETIRRLRAD